MKQLIKRQAWFPGMFALLLFCHQAALSQGKQFTGKNITHNYHQQGRPDPLSRYLKKYSVYTLDVADLAAHVKSNAGKPQFVLNFASQQFHLDLELNDMRGPGFKAVAMSDAGPGELAQTFAGTYKGVERNDRSSTVRLNIDESTFEGYIRKGKTWLYVDKLSRYLPHESKDKIVVYDGADVIPDPTKTCGAELLKAEKMRLEPDVRSTDVALSENCHFLEIATEADYEYYQAFGGNAGAALNRIRNILNLVEGLYTSGLNVKFILKYQQIWTTVYDPYLGDSLQVILPQFQNWWNSYRTYIERDETAMFTGRAVKNGTVGIAYIGTICNIAGYYSCVVNYSPVTNSTIALTAHEFGHNFGAGHDAACNGKNIMCSYIQGGMPEWSSHSLTEITGYINSAGSCMTEWIPDDIIYNGERNNVSYLKLIAANTISIYFFSETMTLSPTGFGYLEAGKSIVLATTNGSSLGFLAPEGSVLLLRISDVRNTCDPLTVAAPGSSSIDESRIVQAPEQVSAVRIVPNPFSSVFELFITMKEAQKARLTIYNSTGVKVKENQAVNLTKGPNVIKVDGSALAGGVYLVELHMGTVKMVSKLVKM